MEINVWRREKKGWRLEEKLTGTGEGKVKGQNESV